MERKKNYSSQLTELGLLLLPLAVMLFLCAEGIMARGLWAPYWMGSLSLSLSLSRSLGCLLSKRATTGEWRRPPHVLYWVRPCLLVPLLEGDGVEWGSTSTYTGW
jgi:hypothetical protein